MKYLSNNGEEGNVMSAFQENLQMEDFLRLLDIATGERYEKVRFDDWGIYKDIEIYPDQIEYIEEDDKILFVIEGNTEYTEFYEEVADGGEVMDEIKAQRNEFAKNIDNYFIECFNSGNSTIDDYYGYGDWQIDGDMENPVVYREVDDWFRTFFVLDTDNEKERGQLKETALSIIDEYGIKER